MDSMFLNECSKSWQWWFTEVFNTKHQGTVLIVASQSPTSQLSATETRWMDKETSGRSYGNILQKDPRENGSHTYHFPILLWRPTCQPNCVKKVTMASNTMMLTKNSSDYQISVLPPKTIPKQQIIYGPEAVAHSTSEARCWQSDTESWLAWTPSHCGCLASTGQRLPSSRGTSAPQADAHWSLTRWCWHNLRQHQNNHIRHSQASQNSYKIPNIFQTLRDTITHAAVTWTVQNESWNAI